MAGPEPPALAVTALLAAAVLQKPDAGPTDRILAASPGSATGTGQAARPLARRQARAPDTGPAPTPTRPTCASASSSRWASTRFPQLDPSVADLKPPSRSTRPAVTTGAARSPRRTSTTASRARRTPPTPLRRDGRLLRDRLHARRPRGPLGSKFRIQQLTMPECPPFEADHLALQRGGLPRVRHVSAPSPRTLVRRTDPDLVIVISPPTSIPLSPWPPATPGPPALDEVRDGFESTP